MSVALVLAALCAAGAAATLVRAVASRREVRASLARAAGIAVQAPTTGVVTRGRRLPVIDRLARLALLARPGASREALALRLTGAGFGRRVSPERYLALQGALLAAAPLFGLAFAFVASPVAGLVAGLAFAGAALLLPDRVVAARLARRQEQVLAELPGALDLLAIAVEAGLGFDAAVARVADAIDGPLAQELSLLLGEIRLGEARQIALGRLAERVAAPDMATFTRAVARADQLGTSLAQTLRIQAVDARARRQVAAEEKAGAAPVKMLLPTVLFIFPPLFVVVLGPTLIALSRFL